MRGKREAGVALRSAGFADGVHAAMSQSSKPARMCFHHDAMFHEDSLLGGLLTYLYKSVRSVFEYHSSTLEHP